MKFEILLASLALLALMAGVFARGGIGSVWRKVKYPFLTTTLLFGALVFGVFQFGAIAGVTAIALIFSWQLLLLSRSKALGACYLTGLSSEQVKEFGEIIESLRPYRDMLASLNENWGEIKTLPDLVANIRRDLNDLRRAAIHSSSRSQLRPGEFVTEDCAKHLGAIAIVYAEKCGKLKELESAQHEALTRTATAILGETVYRSALTSSDIPLPVEYSGQVVSLVNDYGAARRYGTVIPLGTGTLKLPKLSTDPAFGLIGQSVSIPEKSPAAAWVTFTPEKFGGLIRLPSEMAEDSIIAIGQFIADYSSRNIALCEDHNFFMSTGADTGADGLVKGLCFSTIDNSKVVQMASTKTHYSDATLGNIRLLRSKPDASALRRGAYYMHPTFEQHLSGLNTGGDKPYNPTAQLSNPSAAQPFVVGPSFDGFPVRWVDAMPAYDITLNASKVFMLFGDLRYQYLGVRGGLRFEQSKDAAFETDEVLIRALERFTIGLMANGAAGGLETAAA